MEIEAALVADLDGIRRLLAASELPAVDLTPEMLRHFVVVRENGVLKGVGGLEWAGNDALLRSVAVSENSRNVGLAKQMVAALESRALVGGAIRLHLLTTTAHDYFQKLGYRDLPCEQAPDGIRMTAQFSGLCPSSSSFMVKTLKPQPFNVLFLCTGNSARSILAEAIINNLFVAGREFRAFSAGSHPKPAPNPHALQLLVDNHLPIEGMRSKSWDEFAQPDSPPLDFVFTVCDQAAGEPCPFWPAQPMTAHWGVPDPAAVEGSEEEIRRAFLQTFVVLKRRIDLFTSLPIRSLDRLALEKRVQEIGTK